MTTVMTLKEFCEANRISRSTFYRLPPADQPRVLRIGRKILVRPEDAEAWQRRMAGGKA